MSSRPQFSFQRGMPVFRAGLLGVVIIAIVTWFAFTKDMAARSGRSTTVSCVMSIRHIAPFFRSRIAWMRRRDAAYGMTMGRLPPCL